jgi:predicted ABC-type transport system involved in lysophospholipase L1 biosynthesis ATPase subunit
MSTHCGPLIKAYDAIPNVENNALRFPPLSCQIEPSSLTCLVGPHRPQLRDYQSMLAGINPPSQGSVEVLGQITSDLDQAAWQQLRTKIGYVSGGALLLSVQHGLMNVMLPALYHQQLSFREVADKARALLSELGCDFELTTFPALLNSMQRSRVALARALMLDPSLLFLDVPFHDLGANERETMGELLASQIPHRAICMIGGLQSPQFLELHANQIIYISEHKIIYFNNWRSFSQTEDQDVHKLLSALKSKTIQ